MTTSSPSRLVSLVYFSRAASPLSANALHDLLRTSREKNTQRGITGMLLYSNGNFLQVIEGTDSSVTELMAKVGKDLRHHSLSRLAVRPIEKREFSDWSMAFRDISQCAEGGFSAFLKAGFNDDEFQKKSELVYRLILQFKADYSEAQDPTLIAA